MSRYHIVRGITLSIGLLVSQSIGALSFKVDQAAQDIVENYYKTEDKSSAPVNELIKGLQTPNEVEKQALVALLPKFFEIIKTEANKKMYFWGRNYKKSDWWRAFTKSSDDFLMFLCIVNKDDAKALSDAAITVDVVGNEIQYKLNKVVFKAQPVSWFKRHYGKLALATILTAAAAGGAAYYRSRALPEQEASFGQRAWEKTKEFGRKVKSKASEYGKKAMNRADQYFGKRGVSEKWERVKDFGRKAGRRVKDFGNEVSQRADQYFGKRDLQKRQAAALREGKSLYEVSKMEVEPGFTKRRVSEKWERVKDFGNEVSQRADQYFGKRDLQRRQAEALRSGASMEDVAKMDVEEGVAMRKAREAWGRGKDALNRAGAMVEKGRSLRPEAGYNWE